ncbi:MAG: LON peptidase substrate-binding domain-containing protein [Aestuariibacter sp.]
MMQEAVPLFPLSAHILPGGRMALRIFEPRYVRMVKEACLNQSQFCICMFNSQGDKDKNQHIFPVGTLVHIVDFELLDDGLLGITVEGTSLVTIQNIITEKDGLRIGDATSVTGNLFDEGSINKHTKLADKLLEIIESYPEIKELYPEPKFNDLNWVVCRWLELLPIRAEEKQKLLTAEDKSAIPGYIEQLIK